MQNKEIAAMLIKIADTLEIHGDNPYRIRAYRRAARSILHVEDQIKNLVQKGDDITFIPFIGKGIAAQIKFIIEKGELPDIVKDKKQNKFFRSELKDISGLGPKRIAQLQNELNIHTKSELLQAINRGQLRLTKNINPKIEKQILTSIRHPKIYERLFRLSSASLILESLLSKILKLPTVEFAQCASDYRRGKEIVGNTTILIITKQPQVLITKFIEFSDVKELVKLEKKSATVILSSGMQIRIQIVTQNEIGSALLFYTGAEKHIKQLKMLSNAKDFILTKKGLFTAKMKKVASKTENDIYRELSLQFIPPELREGSDEILASQQGEIPNLITLQDIKGDLHTHTNETDGTETLETMVAVSQMKGYEYIAITDHSKRLAITNGMDEKRLLKQIKLIDALNARLTNFRILKSIEVDILEDGRLDLSNDVLKELDIRVCSIHSRFNLSEAQQTARILRAMENPYFNILGHATGRLLKSRKPYNINILQILEAAKENGCVIELNSQPSRLDIKDEYCFMAKRLGVKIAISSDAHSTLELEYMKYGVTQARRGWLEPHDVINTRSVSDLLKLIKR